MSKPIVCGFHSVLNLLKRRAGAVQTVYLSSTRKDSRISEIESLAQRSSIPCVRVEGKVLNRLANGLRHQGVIAECEIQPEQAKSQDIREWISTLVEPSFLLVMDGIQDPRNLGASIRSAHAAGVGGVILPRHRGAGLTSTVSRTAVGAVEEIPVYFASNLPRTLDELKKSGLWIVGLETGASKSIYEIDFAEPSAIVFGSEQSGLRKETKRQCDLVASIPMTAGVNSLNVSVAVGIVSFEVARQRNSKK